MKNEPKDKKVLVLGKGMKTISLKGGRPSCLPPFGPIRPGPGRTIHE